MKPGDTLELKDLAKEYEASAVLLRNRLSELRRMEKVADDPEERWRIRRRIAELTPMLTQMNDLAFMLEHYYEKGGKDQDVRYGFTGCSRRKQIKARQDEENCFPGNRGGTDREAAPSFFGIPSEADDNTRDCGCARRKQVHRKSYFGARRGEDPKDYEVFLNIPDDPTGYAQNRRRWTHKKKK